MAVLVEMICTRHFSFALLIISLFIACPCRGAESIELIKDGNAKAVLLLPADPHPDELLAAEEIIEHLQQMSGVTLSLLKGTQVHSGLIPISIGLSLMPQAEEVIRIQGEDSASFLLSVRADGIHLAGLSPRGTLFGAYELLEQLGIRWFMPGAIGTVVPSTETVTLNIQETVQVPSFQGRILQSVHDKTWMRRTRQGGLNAGAHSMPFRVDRKKHPELFCSVDGKPTRQYRVSHPEILRLAIDGTLKFFRKHPEARYVPMGPADAGGFGVSPWDADDMDPLRGKISVTDRYIKFYNLVLEEVQKEFPKAGIAFYAYDRYMRPPVREKPNPNILPVLAPIDLCRFHSVDNPICPERQYMKKIISGWQALGSRIFYRGYFFNLADQGLPFSMIRQVSEEIPYLQRAGIIGCRVECMPMWGHHAPALYLATRLMWESSADPGMIMDDFFTGFYGPAATPMQTYFNILEEAFFNADYHTGNVFDMPHILTTTVLVDLLGKLTEAKRLVPADSTYAARVAILQQAFDYGKANLAMMAAYNNFRFEEAKKQYDIALGIAALGKNENPQRFYWHAVGYLTRFWKESIGSALERVTNGNEMVARMPDEWFFLLDPLNGGEDLGFFKPGMGTNNWLRMRTSSSSWSNQGLRYYKGEAWYRTTVTIPSRFKGRKIFLWLGGIDEKATAWINGEKLPNVLQGVAPSGRPWEFEATDALRVGEENVVVIKVSNHKLNELGTGGITGPAMFWAE